MWGREEGEREKDTNTEIFEDRKRENKRESTRERVRKRERERERVIEKKERYTRICLCTSLNLHLYVCFFVYVCMYLCVCVRER